MASSSSSNAICTRSQGLNVTCPIFGQVSQMKDNVLPTFSCVIQDFLLTKEMLKIERCNAKLPYSEVAKTIVCKVESIWLKASLPIISHARILKMLKNFYDKYTNILKPYKGRKSNLTYVLANVVI